MTFKIFSNEKQNEDLIFTGFEREEEYESETNINKQNITFDDIFEISKTEKGRKYIQDILTKKVKDKSIKTNTPLIYSDSSCKPGEFIYEYPDGRVVKIETE